MYLMRLDDASEYMDIEKWTRMELLLDKYGVKPIYGIIPANQDPELLRYGRVDNFWTIMKKWQSKGWIPALHGYTHVFETECGGINPVNNRSEFAGVDFERQCKKIRDGVDVLIKNGIDAKIFFAPAHTFDENTLKALLKESDIKIISDTVAKDVYYKDGVFFIPQQSGQCRKLPFRTTTFCYHPNIMSDSDFEKLESFLKKHLFGIVDFEKLKKKKYGMIDWILKEIYFWKRK